MKDLVIMFFFFFKQKTAYEMRISDWSSDVCSSDLIYTLRFLIRIQPEKNGSIIMRRNSKHGAARKTMLRQRIFPTIEPIAIAPQPSDDRKKNRSVPRPAPGIGVRHQLPTCGVHLGRASGGERGGQYGQYSGVAVTCKQK